MATIDFVVKNGLVVNEEAQVLGTTDAASSTDTNAAIYTAGGVAIAKKAFVGTDLGVGGNTIFSGDLAVNGGDITTTATTFNLVNANATTVNFAGAATDVQIGAATGTTEINNNLNVIGDVDIDGGDLTASTATFNLLDSTVTTLNFARAATAITIGNTTGGTIIRNSSLSLNGSTLNIDGVNPTIAGVNLGTASIFNSNITGINFGQSADISMGGTAIGAIIPATTYSSLVGTSILGTGVYLNVTPSATSGSGAGALFNVTKSLIGTSYATSAVTITVASSGSGYAVGDTVTIPGTALGGTTPANNLTFTLGTAVSTGTTTIRNRLQVNGNTTLGDTTNDLITFIGDTANTPNTLTFTIDDTVANNVSYPIRVRHTTSGTAAAGMGVGLLFVSETAGGANRAGVALDAIATDTTNGAENFSFVVDTMTAGGTAAQALLVNNSTLTVGASSTATTINTQLASALTITTGATTVTGVGNAVTVRGGPGGSTSGAGGALSLVGGDATTQGAGGQATFRSGNATGTDIVGTDTIIEGGQGTGLGRSGQIVFRTGPAGASTGTTRNPLSTVLTLTAAGLDVPGDIVVSGNLTVNGTTTTINTNTLTVDDKNIEIGSVVAVPGLQATLATGTNVVTLTGGTTTSGLIPGQTVTVTSGPGAFGASPLIASVDSRTQITLSVNHATAGAVTFTAGGVTDFTADGGGITLRGATNKTFNWVRTTGNWTSNVNVSAPAFVSTVAAGTAPLTVTSDTVVTNLNADLLDGQQGSWYQDWANITNKPDPVVTVTLTGDVSGTANATLTDLGNGTISVATTIAANSVALGTDTTGNYMIDVTAGTGISISHTQGEGSTATITNNGVTSIVAGNAISISGGTGAVTVNHVDTSTVTDVTAAANQFVSGITFDTYGHVQTITRAAPSGFLTAESDTLTTVASRGNIHNGVIETTVRPRVGVTTYKDHSTGAFNDAAIRSRTGAEDVWIYCDEANAQWGIYHRNIDSALVVAGEQTLPANSIAFIGANTLTSFISLSDGSAFFRGSISAASKSFLIDHPTKPGMQLRYGSLEGPENGVYVRGKLVDATVIELPDYWTGLVHADSITVNLTAAGPGQQLYVEKIENNCVYVVNETSKPVNCFYTVYGERKDVDKLVVEFE